jgi:hypothetical protein
MGLTTGTALFYGGIAGAALSLAASVAAIFVFRGGGKRLKKKLDDEYGGKQG